jgi:hypothetical protein
MMSRVARLVTVGWLALVVAGCGLTLQQKAAVQKFAVATAGFATLTSSEFVSTRGDLIEMNTLRVELGDDAVRADRTDAPFTVERVKVRVDAATALRDYADLLNALATSSQTEQLRNAADGFVASLRKVQGVNLSDEKAGAIGMVVQQVGGLAVEYMRAKAVRDVVTTTHEPVLQVIEQVRKDFDPKADHWSLGYAATIVALRGAADLAAAGPGAVAKAPLIGRARVLAERNKQRFDAVAVEVAASVAALREAQINLRNAVQSRDITVEEIQSYAARVEDLIKVYRILRAP